MVIDKKNTVFRNYKQRGVFRYCKFHDPRSRGLCARPWPYNSYSENALFYFQKISLFTPLHKSKTKQKKQKKTKKKKKKKKKKIPKQTEIYSNNDRGRP